jgi:hypothetical protein
MQFLVSKLIACRSEAGTTWPGERLYDNCLIWNTRVVQWSAHTYIPNMLFDIMHTPLALTLIYYRYYKTNHKNHIKI